MLSRKLWLAVLSVLFLLLLDTSSSAGSRRPITITGDSGLGVAAGGAPDVLAAMDFEDSACVDSQGGGWVAVEVTNGNCDGTGLDGSSVGGDVNTSDGSRIQDLAIFAERTTGFVTADFQIDTTSNGAGVVDSMFAIVNDANEQQCSVRYIGTTPALKAFMFFAGASGTKTIVDDTLYYLRLRLDLDEDRCFLAISTSGYGLTDVGSHDRDEATSVSAASGWSFRQAASNNTADLGLDNVRLCTGDAGTGMNSGCTNQ